MYKRTKARIRKYESFQKKQVLQLREKFESVIGDQTKIDELFDEQDRENMKKFNEIFGASLDIESILKRKQENRKSLTTTEALKH